MKTYKTSLGQQFKVDFATSLTAGYGHKTIVAVLMAENGETKKVSATTSNMHGYDAAMELDGQEKAEALFDLVANSLDDQLVEWLPY